MIKVMIADDHPIVRAGLKQFILNAPDMEIVGEASNGEEVFDKLKNLDCDVLVLDINMPGKDGFEVLRFLKSNHFSVKILVLSVHSESQVAMRVLSAGAFGYLSKESIKDDLLGAIRRVYGGKRFVSAAVADKLIDLVQEDKIVLPHERLSNREFQIFAKIVVGIPIKEISAALAISVKTVRTHKDRILKKMNLVNEIELTRYALTHGLVDKSGTG